MKAVLKRKNPMQKGAVLLTYARTGSNNLTALLNSHPGFHFHGEIFSPKTIMSFKGYKRFEKKLELDFEKLREENLVRFIELAFTIPKGRFARKGFKLFHDHNPAALKLIAERRGIKLIVLRRANMLASFSSAVIGRETGAWKSTAAAAGTSEPVEIKFDKREFDLYRKRLERRLGEVDSLLEGRPNVFRIEYRETADPAIQTKLIKFLGGRLNVSLATKLEKQNSRRVVDRFSNPQDVLRHLEELGKPEWADQG